MINNISQTITAISEFPQRSQYGSSQSYGLAVETWLGKYGNLSAELLALITALNTFISETNTAVTTTNDNVTATNADVLLTNADVLTIMGAVAELPDGVINDLTTTLTDTWSSTKINSEITTQINDSKFNYVSKTANYTALSNDYIYANASGGAFTITMPLTPSNDDRVNVFNTDTTNTLTVDGNGKNIILKDTTDTLIEVNTVIKLEFIYDGTQWRIG